MDKSVEELARKLWIIKECRDKDVDNAYYWHDCISEKDRLRYRRLARHVKRMVLEARIKELDILDMHWCSIIDERKKVIHSQLNALQEEK